MDSHRIGLREIESEPNAPKHRMVAYWEPWPPDAGRARCACGYEGYFFGSFTEHIESHGGDPERRYAKDWEISTNG